MGIWGRVRRFFSPLGRDRHPSRTPVAPIEPAQPRPPERVKGPSRRPPVVVGLDFGTSSTKLAFRPLGESTTWIAPAIEPSPNLSWFCTPTSYEHRDGRVFFGRCTATSEDNLKLDLLRSASPPGAFGLAERRAVGYLGWLVEAALDAVRRQVGLEELRLVLNVGVPVSYFGSREEFQKRLAKYDAVARAAVATTTIGGGTGIRQGMESVQLDRRVDDGIQRWDSVDYVAVLPESIAALVSLQADPHTEAGLYSVVDIGAGTTEVSTSTLVVRAAGDRLVNCYMDSTRVSGALDLARVESEQRDPKELLDQWWKQWAANWEASRRKDAHNRHQHLQWRETTILFTGGGGFHPLVRSHFANALRQRSPARQVFCDYNVSVKVQGYEPSAQAMRPVRGESERERSWFHLLAVAHGLAHHRREWPDWYRPDDVQPLEPPEPADLPYDPYDAGYSGR